MLKTRKFSLNYHKTDRRKLMKNVKFLVITLAVALLFCATVTAGEKAEEKKKIDNPAYQAWSEFREGAFAEFTSTSKVEDMTMETTVRMTLLEITDDKAVVETTVSVTVQGNKIEQPGIKMELSAEIDADDADKSKELEKGKETITVGEEKFKTEWVKKELESGDDKIITTTWSNDDIPGECVKMVIVGEATEITMILTSYGLGDDEEEGEEDEDDEDEDE